MEKTHYMTYKRKTYDGKTRIDLCELTEAQYEWVLKMKKDHSCAIELPNKDQTIIDWKQIDIIERMKPDIRQKLGGNTEDYLVICNDCDHRFPIEELKTHGRECLRIQAQKIKYQNSLHL